jgi:hypothetical protein
LWLFPSQRAILFFSQNLHCVLGEEITKIRPDSCNSHGESIFRGQLRSGSVQATKLGLGHEREGGRESLAEGPRQRFRGVQDIQVQNSGVQGIQVNRLKGLKSRAARGSSRTNHKKRVNADIQQ